MKRKDLEEIKKIISEIDNSLNSEKYTKEELQEIAGGLSALGSSLGGWASNSFKGIGRGINRALDKGAERLSRGIDKVDKAQDYIADIPNKLGNAATNISNTYKQGERDSAYTSNKKKIEKITKDIYSLMNQYKAITGKTFRPYKAVSNPVYENMQENEMENNDTDFESIDIEQVLNDYLETALWTDEENDLGDENGEKVYPLKGRNIHEFSEEAKNKAKEDIVSFLEKAKNEAPDELKEALSDSVSRSLGGNIWLSRNGHGAGFFDDNLDTLQNIARGMGVEHVYTESELDPIEFL